MCDVRRATVVAVAVHSLFVFCQALQDVCFELRVVRNCILQFFDLLPRLLRVLLGVQHERTRHGPTRGVQGPPAVLLHVLPTRDLNLPVELTKEVWVL